MVKEGSKFLLLYTFKSGGGYYGSNEAVALSPPFSRDAVWLLVLMRMPHLVFELFFKLINRSRATF